VVVNDAGGIGGVIAPKDFVSLDERSGQIESLIALKNTIRSSIPPERPPRPDSLYRELAAGMALPLPPPIPEHLSSSGIACVEQLPWWVRVMGPTGGPVLREDEAPRGGLGSHPIDLEDLRRPRGRKMAVAETSEGMEEDEIDSSRWTGKGGGRIIGIGEDPPIPLKDL
jgi:hypothetical protein